MDTRDDCVGWTKKASRLERLGCVSPKGSKRQKGGVRTCQILVEDPYTLYDYTGFLEAEFLKRIVSRVRL